MQRLVTEYLDYSSELFPDKIAVTDECKCVTFRQLREAAFHIASILINQGQFKKPIVVYLNKSVECVATFMGIAYSGNFYAPIDKSMPWNRIRKILKTLQPTVLITDLKSEKKLREILDGYPIEIVAYEKMLESVIKMEKIRATSVKIIDTDLLYVLFTSGSTGEPKGVTVSHRAVMDYTEWVAETFQINHLHVFGNQAPFYFDNSVLDIYQTIKNGATMHIIPERLFSFPIYLLKYLQEKEINIIFWVPSALCLLANRNALDSQHLSNLKKILFCGEVMPNKQLNIWRKAYPQALFANLYGPTEITDVCTCYIIDRNFADNEPLPIGTACRNTDIFLLRDDDSEAKDGEVGEICVRGCGLSYGYYNNPVKTTEVFVQNPLQKAYPEIIYRTGDLAHYNERGELIYDGRKDFQIKYMGHRVELGEIETMASSIKEVAQACCLYNEKEKEIVLFFSGNISESSLIEKLQQLLPSYMVPSGYRHMESIPLTLNGKFDRKRLQNQYINQQ